MMRHMNPRHQVTKPASVLKRLGEPEYFEISERDGLIVFKPVAVVEKKAEEKPLELTEGEWEKLGKLVEKQLEKWEYTEYRDFEKAKHHARKLKRSE